ncbi:hypothetical protein [Pontixanthobacter aquaemixtae]|uniref:Uncharacterized protein n=1 Tax=Pontixanthobacter aquaemixtae TaxID=1958940 RepID=A0A844ZR17_9SPHN|nr:hypothetical protein [Pontixanthobacter aquaemixtae]MXO90263.1 hypothetical protein [Pontixanthobacter aquaemixtae]
MLISATLIPLALAAGSADQLEDARIAYTHCLIRLHNTSVDEQITVPAFKAKIKTACLEERAKYHASVVASERGYGASSAEATEYADEEIADLIDGFNYDFSQNREVKTKLVIE